MFLFWKIVEPYALALVTAGIFTIIMAPVDNWLNSKIANKKISVFITVVSLFLIVLIPMFIFGVLVVDQAVGVINNLDKTEWVNYIDFTTNPIFQSLPPSIQNSVASFSSPDIGKNTVELIVKNLGDVFSKSASLAFNTFIFFISLYYFLIDRKRIYETVLELSPLKDRLDNEIVDKITRTVRSVVFGSLIIASIQAVLAIIGMLVLGVPGALLWGSFVIVAAQVPIVGVGLVMVPAVLYLVITGSYASALGLFIWSVFAVGFIDNLLRPVLLGAKTQMPELLVLVSILGGVSYFGPIGLILGPTVLALILVMIDLYKAGILDGK